MQGVVRLACFFACRELIHLGEVRDTPISPRLLTLGSFDTLSVKTRPPSERGQIAAHQCLHGERHRLPDDLLTGSEEGTHRNAFALIARIPNRELKVLPGAGHACQVEQPRLFDRFMIEFPTKHGLTPALCLLESE